jgi:hypothetical protein
LHSILRGSTFPDGAWTWGLMRSFSLPRKRVRFSMGVLSTLVLQSRTSAASLPATQFSAYLPLPVRAIRTNRSLFGLLLIGMQRRTYVRVGTTF